MAKREEFKKALIEAQKAKDEVTTTTLRMVLAAVKDKDINARPGGNSEGIADSEILSLLQGMIKQRQESRDTYKGAGRMDLADREDAEIKIIERFMPAQMSDADITAAIDKLVIETGAQGMKDMGKVMAALKTHYAGQMDMAKAGAVVKAKLG
ncbi:MAG: GatB/YqeY domain-containing protein [Alphaproteobacteria bacterium]|nr:GatB/YqeY domain-containing protein [Alphaproteobacteria bacterium]